MKKKQFDIITFTGIVEEKAELFNLFREYVTAFFQAVETVPAKGDERKPTLGIRLDLPNGGCLAIMPGWTPPEKSWQTVAYTLEKQPLSYRSETHNGVEWWPVWEQIILKPGILHLDTVKIEYLNPGIKYKMTLEQPDRIDAQRYYNMDYCRENIKLIAGIAHSLLMDPMATFAQQHDACSCCHKALTDRESRLRGIGPECLRRMSVFETLHKKVTAVDKYRLRYYRETGFVK